MTVINPICVALDTPDLERAKNLARELKLHAGYLKLGMEFFYANGRAGYEAVAAQGLPIFLDLKLHDIPNTVAQGLNCLMALSPRPAIVNVHAQGGYDMMKAARDAIAGRATLIAVTILTSLSSEDIWNTGLNPALKADAHALNLASQTYEAGLDGIVCSPHDLAGVRQNLPRALLTIVPGIRPADANAHDQKRIATPKSAIDQGADILVIGRAITGAKDPVLACQNILAELRA